MKIPTRADKTFPHCGSRLVRKKETKNICIFYKNGCVGDFYYPVLKPRDANVGWDAEISSYMSSGG